MKLTILFILVTAIAFPQDDTLIQKEDNSFIETYINEYGYIVKHIVNKKYDLVSSYNNGEFLDILLDETLDHTIIPGVEGRRTKIKIVAFGMENNRFEEKLWEINDVGYKVEKYGKYLKLVNYGCCGEDNSYIYYNSKTGKNS